MKNISFQLLILLLLIFSCTTDNVENIDTEIIRRKTENTARLEQDFTPANPANTYDIAGKLHNDILDIYLAGNYQHSTIVQISQQIEIIATANSDLILLDTGTNLPINLDKVQEIVNNPQIRLDQEVVNSTLTIAAKESLSSFMNDVFLRENRSYQEIHESIISYEAIVIENQDFNNEDKRIILTTSSIIRYSMYHALIKKDKDWDISIGHNVGGLIGAIDNSSAAIRYSLVTGIFIHNALKEL
ncbi:hypothetical protein Flavo103_10020 [Flavobacterium collinsii]|uniref:hypothetical protein n=1 Tax=Flavobacterium collinsii TaxID=1114861 RepID=UPI0022C5A112|nr:hypothetical protein [Flavobacterium collinsii]GIQ57866.1 hypothetical protein Flavo103_10020 [Flavobacterium collinsii]